MEDESCQNTPKMEETTTPNTSAAIDAPLPTCRTAKLCTTVCAGALGLALYTVLTDMVVGRPALGLLGFGDAVYSCEAEVSLDTGYALYGTGGVRVVVGTTAAGVELETS